MSMEQNRRGDETKVEGERALGAQNGPSWASTEYFRAILSGCAGREIHGTNRSADN
jgi:hypothetical protein